MTAVPTPSPTTSQTPASTAWPTGWRVRSLTVEAAAGPVLVQDLGRPGHASIGVSRSGAVDRAALRLANRLLANLDDAAGLEVMFGRVRLRASGYVTVAVTGAPVPVRAGGRAAGVGAPIPLAPGDVVEVGAGVEGVYVYVAVRGGVAVPEVLGSRSRDTLAGLGPRPLLVGDSVPVGAPPGTFPVVDAVPSPAHGAPVARVVPGPRHNWFAPDALTRLVGGPWWVDPISNRAGVRLRRDGDGPHLARSRAGELPSEGMVRGAIQVPPSGSPVVLGPDHPVTGGYPVLAVVLDADIDAVLQVLPGREVRFRLV